MKRLLLLAAGLALSACTTLGVSTPDTFNKRIATAYTLVQTVGDSATAAVQAGKLSPSDAGNVVTTGKAALAGLDVVRALHDSACPATAPATCAAPAADAKLTSTLAVLAALQAYLATQGAK